MAHWLFKSEPAAWSWADQVARGAAGEPWDGVRSHQAMGHMRRMRPGEQGFFYHSQTERSVVGVVEVIEEARPDPGDETGVWHCVRVRAVEPLPHPVSLAAIKARPDLAGMALVRQSRLSVSEVSQAEWRAIRAMGGLAAEA